MRFPQYFLLCGIFFLAQCLQAQDASKPSPPFPEYQTFSEALLLSELRQTLENGGAFTVFAPSDNAFRKLDERLNLQHPGNRKQLKTLLSYHIVAGELTASRILKALCRGEGAAVFTTVQGEQLIATLEGVDIVLMDCSGNTSRIVQADTYSQNLVMHEIDRVILPGTPIP
jgi:uncharacterized surface protein with fasciclin (FAS1) repeats